MDAAERIAIRIADEQRPFLLLVIGLPGSGKSTYAASVPNASHYEADMFFVDGNGVYNFDRSRLRDAHGWCQRMVGRDLAAGRSVVVSNTCLQQWEREIYYRLAEQYGAKIRVKVMGGNYGNIHDVPEETLDAMRKRFQPIGRSEIEEHGIEVIP